MALISGLERPSLLMRIIPYVQWGAFVGLSGILISQCQSINTLNQSIVKMQKQPVAVTIGSNAFVEVGKPLTPEKNAEEFMREVLPLLQTLSNKLPKEMDPTCKQDKNCTEGKDDGIKVNGVQVPTLVGIAANAIVPSARQPTLTSVMENAEKLLKRPVKWTQGETLAYQVFTINPQGNNEYEVLGGYYHYSAKGEPIAAYEHDLYLSLRPILPPKPIANPTSVQKAIAVALSRGWQISDVEVLR